MSSGNPPPEQFLADLAGIAPAHALGTACGRHAVRRAVADGRIMRLSPGWYGLSDPRARGVTLLKGLITEARETAADQAQSGAEVRAQQAEAWGRLARTCRGSLVRRSAALALGLRLWTDPTTIEIGLARSTDRRPPSGLTFVRTPLGVDDLRRGHTDVVRTVFDCAATLPLTESLAVADSALRADPSLRPALRARAEERSGPRALRIRAVVGLASPLAANPFESALRALALIAGVPVRPQVEIELPTGEVIRPDLVDRRHRIVIEADSVEYHAGSQAFRRDVERTTALSSDGWLVLRFTWWQVMFEPDQVISTLRRAVVTARGRAGPGRAREPTAAHRLQCVG